ncbi:MAG: dihydrofolate reductase [Saprospiraceae bacterium]|nr:dihydrofolate reductase [Saprospiraceae bacterium]
MKVSAIVAASKNSVIGNDNEIPWYLQEDFKFFKQTTMNHCIIMGRKTFDSIGKPLPKRTNIVITRNPFFVASGVIVVSSLEEALMIADESGETEAFIIGGGTIYKQAFPILDCIYYTEVQTELEGDTFFPEINTKIWTKSILKSQEANDKNDFDFEVQLLEKIY